MRRIAIIGGGISGLSAAYCLEQQKRRGLPLEFVLYESGERPGGVIRTEQVEGCLVEGGPDSFLTEKPWAADLCRQLGLGGQLIGSQDAGRKTYLLVKGRLVAIPDGLMFMVPTRLVSTFFSPLFSFTTKLRIVREWFYRPRPDDADSTVAEFVQRHYGREMVERVADPLLAGVYGGSADELSVKSVLSRFVDMEAKYGSLGRAMVAARRKRAATQAPPLFTTLKDGMQELINALLRNLPAPCMRLNTRVDEVRPEVHKWLVVSGGQTEEFDAVILALPAYAAAAALARVNAELASELKAIPYSSSATVTFGYDQAVRASLPPGFGFLVPRTEQRRLLAVTFVHNKFAYRAPDGRALVRCFLGGSHDPEIAGLRDAEILAIARRELREILGINTEPGFARIYKWQRAMAQYVPGHGQRLRRIRELMTSLPALALAGNAYEGIGVPDCVRSGTEAATKVLDDLGMSVKQPSAQSSIA